MHPAPPGLADGFGQRLHERRHVVVRSPLDLRNPLRRRDGSLRTDLLDIAVRDAAEASPALDRQDLDTQPVGELRLLRPHGGHLGQRVPGDHAGDSPTCVGTPTVATPSSSVSLNSCIRTRIRWSRTATIWAARIAALTAPLMATVATGTPRGICTVDSSASIPSRCF